MDYNPQGPCEYDLGRFVDALTYLNELKEKIPDQAEAAPGRLRDLFEFLPKHLERIAPLEEEKQASVAAMASNAVKIIDEARDKMMEKGTKQVSQYIPDYTPNLTAQVTELERFYFREAGDHLKECMCDRTEGGTR